MLLVIDLDLSKREHFDRPSAMPANDLFGAPGRAHCAQAQIDQVWCLVDHLEVQVLYGP
jgi:hypothetical protein